MSRDGLEAFRRQAQENLARVHRDILRYTDAEAQREFQRQIGIYQGDIKRAEDALSDLDFLAANPGAVIVRRDGQRYVKTRWIDKNTAVFQDAEGRERYFGREALRAYGCRLRPPDPSEIAPTPAERLRSCADQARLLVLLRQCPMKLSAMLEGERRMAHRLARFGVASIVDGVLVAKP